MPVPMPLAARFDEVEAVVLRDFNGQANNGNWLNLKDAEGVMIRLHMGVGTGGQNPTLTLNQATSSAGAGSKALNIKTSPYSHIWKKQAATSLAAVTSWTDATADVSTNTWTNTNAGAQALLVEVWVDAAELDVANGFYYVQAAVASVGAAKVGSLTYLVVPAYMNRPDKVVNYFA